MTLSEEEARRQAIEILSQRRYHPRETPKPFRGLLDGLGRLLQPVLEPIGRFLAKYLGPIWREPLGRIALAAAVLLLAGVVAAALGTRRAASAVERERKRERELEDDPDGLDAAAADAEREGRFEQAVRLRFRAGLIRLARAGRVHVRPSSTVDAVRRDLALDRFDPIGRAFEEIAYGGREATPDDATRARTEWDALLREIAAREKTATAA